MTQSRPYRHDQKEHGPLDPDRQIHITNTVYAPTHSERKCCSNATKRRLRCYAKKTPSTNFRVSVNIRTNDYNSMDGSHGHHLDTYPRLFVGLIAKFLMPGREPSGFIITIVLGIAGAFLASWIGQKVHWYEPGQAAGFIASIVGAMILLFIYNLFVRHRDSV